MQTNNQILLILDSHALVIAWWHPIDFIWTLYQHLDNISNFLDITVNNLTCLLHFYIFFNIALSLLLSGQQKFYSILSFFLSFFLSLSISHSNHIYLSLLISIYLSIYLGLFIIFYVCWYAYMYESGNGRETGVQSHTKDPKMVLDAALLNTQHCKVRIKGKAKQSRETSSAFPYISK